MNQAKRFLYTHALGAADDFGLQPRLPLRFERQGQSLETVGLLDTGSMVSVLPFGMGLALGLEWSSLRFTLPPLGSNLAYYETRPVILTTTIGEFAPVNLAFAWTKAEQTPLLLGQINFFEEFEVCFYRAQKAFEVKPKDTENLGALVF